MICGCGMYVCGIPLVVQNAGESLLLQSGVAGAKHAGESAHSSIGDQQSKKRALQCDASDDRTETRHCIWRQGGIYGHGLGGTSSEQLADGALTNLGGSVKGARMITRVWGRMRM